MTFPRGNSEFCFTSILNVPLGFALGNIEAQEKSKLTIFLGGYFVIPSNSNKEQTAKKLSSSRRVARCFKVHDLIKCDSKVQVKLVFLSWVAGWILTPDTGNNLL